MKTFLLGIFFTLAALIAGALLISFSGYAPVAASSKDSTMVRWFLHGSYERAVRRAAANILVSPAMGSRAMKQRGARNFAAMCAGCHTPPGTRPSAVSLGLNPPAPKAIDLASKLSMSERFWVIQNGIRMTGMPAFGPSHRSDEEVWSLVAFTEQLATLESAGYTRLVQQAKKALPNFDGHDHQHMGESAGHFANKAEQSARKGSHSNNHEEGQGVNVVEEAPEKAKADTHDHSAHAH